MDFAYDPQRLGDDVKMLFCDAASAIIVAPFITKAGLLPLTEVLAPKGRIDIVTRWDPVEIRAGASDPMIIDIVEARGGTVRLLPRLHAKVYCVGERALIGSANPTGPGLGFSNPANIEALVPISTTEPALSRLFATVNALASKTDRDYAMELLAYASTLPESLKSIMLDVNSGSASWVPSTTVAKRVQQYYFGQILEREDYRSDLEAIEAPGGLSADAFRAHVGLMLRQGLVGRIYQECEGLQQFSGVERMLQIFAEAGITVEDEKPVMVWQRLLNWFDYYLSSTSSLNGGFSAGRNVTAT